MNRKLLTLLLTLILTLLSFSFLFNGMKEVEAEAPTNITIAYNDTFEDAAFPTSSHDDLRTHTDSTAGIEIAENSVYKSNTYKCLIFQQGNGFLYNTESLGVIHSVKVYYGAGTASGGKIGVYFGDSQLTSRLTTSQDSIASEEPSHLFTNSTDGLGYFQISSSAKAVRITTIEIVAYSSGTLPSTYTISVNNGTGGGEITRNETTNITATDQTNKVFTHWTNNLDPTVLLGKTETITSVTDITYTANFADVHTSSTSYIDFTRNSSPTGTVNASLDNLLDGSTVYDSDAIDTVTGSFTTFYSGDFIRSGNTNNSGVITITLNDYYEASGVVIKYSRYGTSGTGDTVSFTINDGGSISTTSGLDIHYIEHTLASPASTITVSNANRANIYSIELTGVTYTPPKNKSYMQAANALVDSMGVVRVLGTADSLSYYDYGFDITVTRTSDSTVKYNSYSLHDSSIEILSTIKAVYNGASDTYTASTIDPKVEFEAIYGLEIYGIPEGTYTFEVTAWFKETDVSSKTNATTRTFTVTVTGESVTVSAS